MQGRKLARERGKRRGKGKEKTQGYTLLEALFVVAIVALVSGFALNMHDLAGRYMLKAAVGEQAGFMAGVRLQALARHEAVTICPLGRDLHCADGWGGGLLAFFDRNGNKKIDDAEVLIGSSRFATVIAGVQLGSFNQSGVLVFDAQGLARYSNATITFCDKSHGHAESLIISRAGRIRQKRAAAGDCPA